MVISAYAPPNLMTGEQTVLPASPVPEQPTQSIANFPQPHEGPTALLPAKPTRGLGMDECGRIETLPTRFCWLASHQLWRVLGQARRGASAAASWRSSEALIPIPHRRRGSGMVQHGRKSRWGRRRRPTTPSGQRWPRIQPPRRSSSSQGRRQVETDPPGSGTERPGTQRDQRPLSIPAMPAKRPCRTAAQPMRLSSANAVQTVDRPNSTYSGASTARDGLPTGLRSSSGGDPGARGRKRGNDEGSLQPLAYEIAGYGSTSAPARQPAHEQDACEYASFCHGAPPALWNRNDPGEREVTLASFPPTTRRTRPTRVIS
jgi:hypothetical protein